MDWITNELIFYGGLCLAAVSVVALIIHFVSYKFRKMKVTNQLIKEYGEPSVQNKRHKGGR